MLKIDAHPYSPSLLHRIAWLAGRIDSFESAAIGLQIVGEMQISARTINNLTAELGEQLAEDRDFHTRAYEQQALPRVPKQVDPRPQLAAVFCDGGRMRTRAEGGGHGVHEPHWRETKNAALHRMQSQSWETDPQPELPDCLCDQAYVEKLVLGLKKAKIPQAELMSEPAKDAPTPAASPPQEPLPWQPKTLFRTCVSSLVSSQRFGPMMAAEADARGFFAADKRAFLGDGQPYNWSIQRQWFPTFTPIADFIHVVEYLYEAAKAVGHDQTSSWQWYLKWAQTCWQGDVHQVIEELHVHSSRSEPAQAVETETDKIVRSVMIYLTNNRSRMDYARYRKEGLPVTSSLAESLVKQVSKRVKGTEKFWNDGASGEAILQIRAAVLCEDNRLASFIRARAISPYSPRCRAPTLAIAA